MGGALRRGRNAVEHRYWVVGADGNEYGPVSLAEMAGWAREGRVVRSTPVRRDDGRQGEAASFEEITGYQLPPRVEPAGVPGEQFEVWSFISRAFDLVRPHWLALAAMFFIFSLIGSAGNYIHLIIGGALMIGIWRALLGLVDGRTPEIGMLFNGFDRFGEAFLAYIVTTFLTVLGFFSLIVPGIILVILWAFTYPIIAETQLGFWDAMQRSVALTAGYRWQLFLLGLACLPILMLGLMAAIIGVFFALPICFTAFALAYRWLQARRGDLPQPA